MSFSFGVNLNPLQVPIFNGVVRSFGHVQVVLANNQIITGGFTSIKRSRKREREFPMSNGPDPIGKTQGENKYSASLTLYYDWFMQQIQLLGDGYGDQPFTVKVGYQGAGMVPYTDLILGCTFDSTEADDASGNKALIRELDLGPTKILFGGLDDVADPLTAFLP